MQGRKLRSMLTSVVLVGGILCGSLLISEALDGSAAGAYCSNGNAIGVGTNWGIETSSASTCDGDNFYIGTIKDIKTDGSCVWVNHNPNVQWQVSQSSCNATGISYAYSDSNSYVTARLCRTGGCTAYWANRSV